MKRRINQFLDKHGDWIVEVLLILPIIIGVPLLYLWFGGLGTILCLFALPFVIRAIFAVLL
jgi:ABC-type nitrate/sulfonate/bicarbonate transport system permease component